MACPAAGDPIIGFLKGGLERQPARVIPFKGFLGSHSQALFRASVTRLTHPLPVPPYVRHSRATPKRQALILSMRLIGAEYMRGRMISAYERLRECVELSRQHGFGRIARAA
jgi:hypothetical protein